MVLRTRATAISLAVSQNIPDHPSHPKRLDTVLDIVLATELKMFPPPPVDVLAGLDDSDVVLLVVVGLEETTL